MKKPFLALLLLVGAAAMVAGNAFAIDENLNNELGNKMVNAKSVQERLSSRAMKLRTSAGPDPDSVWFGHSYTNHFSATTNYWNLWTGVNQPGEADPNNAIWDWDHSTGFGAFTGDSLAGWWPIRRAYSITGGLTMTDDQRPWWAHDMGNIGNYVINAGLKRTFGVVGYWHHDAGSAVGTGVTWSPLAGSKSAWCGLRQHGDNSVSDLVTGNPYNQTVLEYQNESGGTLAQGTNKRFPGYTNMMDQMLYRDIALTLGSTLNVSFLYQIGRASCMERV